MNFVLILSIELEIVEDNNIYTANTVWSYTLPTDLYGALSGNVQKLDNGNYFITTIGNEDGAYSLEITENHETVWQCKYNLYAVNCHHSLGAFNTINFGHYTSIVKNRYDNRSFHQVILDFKEEIFLFCS